MENLLLPSRPACPDEWQLNSGTTNIVRTLPHNHRRRQELNADISAQTLKGQGGIQLKKLLTTNVKQLPSSKKKVLASCYGRLTVASNKVTI
jgi:hypothetical protein